MNKTAQYRLTIVVPVYDEQENMAALEAILQKYLPVAGGDEGEGEGEREGGGGRWRACALFVNDGSRDQSPVLIREMCARNPDFFYLDLARNGGLSAAMKAGIDAAGSEWVGYMDADLQTTPEDFNLLIPFAGEYQMVMGIRTGRKDSLVKNLSSRFANGFRRMMTHDGVEDTGCPLKILRTDYARRIPFFTGMHRFLPALIQLQGARVRQVPVRHFPRVAGRSKYHLWNRLAGPLFDCFAYRWMRKRYIDYSVADTNLH